ncbi:BamA/TamA family outer membrane protein [Vibrio mediterranei]|uniref:BamA/TamA family outer membrane protein n=1 Tax=Vibrio mediterranei TaxID=689 RepID=UPI00156BE967|nr:BamA/TamA family outer membrane protein [Vibrio mediterranei]
MTYRRIISVIAAISCSLTAVVAQGATPTNVKSRIDRQETPDRIRESMVLPYLFSTETMGLNVGVGGMIKGIYQDQMTIGGTVFGGETSYALAGGVWNYMIPGTERVFLSAYGMFGYYPKQRAYTSGNAYYTPPRPGSNGSSNLDYLEADGASNWFDIKMEYVLPIGVTKDKGLVDYQIRNGLLVSDPSGGREWNPLTSGSTIFVARQFNRYQSFEFQQGDVDGAIHAMEFGILYDNTDFAPNPSYGSRQYIATSHDWGWFESKKQWSFNELDMSKYFSLGKSDWASQRIIAMNFWTGYSPTWEVTDNPNGTQSINGNAPYNEGATLGGFTRMRGYDNNRFHDKAVIYGSAEYRYTLAYNPIKDISWLNFLRVDWIQLVGFVEVGRVGSAYTANELLTDLKYDGGASVRALMAGLVVRADLAKSPESTNFWIMVDHPF